MANMIATSTSMTATPHFQDDLLAAFNFEPLIFSNGMGNRADASRVPIIQLQFHFVNPHKEIICTMVEAEALWATRVKAPSHDAMDITRLKGLGSLDTSCQD
jgi:hypothetical protein